MSQDQQPKRNTLGVNKTAASQPSARRKPVRPGGKPKARPPQDDSAPKFGKKFGRPEGARGARPAGKGPARKDGGSFGDRPPRRDGAGFGDRPPRLDGAGFGDRPPRRDGPSFGDRPPRRDGAGFGDRPPRRDGPSFGDRPPRRDGASFGDRPPRRDGASFGDRPPRRDGAGFGDRPPRRDNFEQGSRPPRQDSGGFSDRPPRRDGGSFSDRPPRRDGASFGGRPPRRDGPSFGDRPPRRDNFEQGSRPPRQDGGSFSDRPPRRDGGNFSDRPPRRDGPSFGDRPPRRDSFEQDARPPRRDNGGVSELVQLARQRAQKQGNNTAAAAHTDTAPEQEHYEQQEEQFTPQAEVQKQPIAGEFVASEPIVLQTEDLKIFLPCAAGVQDMLAEEIARITGQALEDFRITRGGIALLGNWKDVMLLNLHSRLAVRVMVAVAHDYYSNEADLYTVANAVPWHAWFKNTQSFKIELTSQNSGLQSMNFAALKIKDAVVDAFREHTGARPDVDTHQPQVRLHVHLTQDEVILYIDTSGESLFKRGWRQDTGDAPLKETLAAALLAASGWTPAVPLYDPCCGSGTIAIEAAQIAANIAPGSLRSFGFEKLSPFVREEWLAIKKEAAQAVLTKEKGEKITIFGSDVAHRMVDFAERNAERAGVADFIEFRGGDALQRKPPCEEAGTILLNPPYGERIETGGFSADEDDFFQLLATHWKNYFDGWTAWVLSPDLRLPGRMHLSESRKVPLWNGPIECRLFKFEVQGKKAAVADADADE